MATKTAIANLAAIEIGEDIFTDVDTDGTNPADIFNALWTPTLEHILTNGPEEGWQFASSTYHGIDRDSITITALSQESSTTTRVTGTHTLIAGDMVILDDTNIDDTYDVNSVSTTVSFVITATFSATDTGTAYWTSEKYAYRYSIPTSLEVTKVSVGGVELTDWKRKGSWILTNEESDEVDITYILPVASLTVTDFPTWFVDILWRRLAAQMAFKISENTALRDRLVQEVETIYLPRAIAIDSGELYVQEDSDSWVEIGRTTTTIE